LQSERRLRKITSQKAAQPPEIQAARRVHLQQRTVEATMIKGIKFASIPEQRWIELGIPGADTRVVLFKFGESLQPGSQMNITFWADDVEATAREMKSKGVQFVMEPKREDWGTAAAFKDLDGNTFVLGSK
jgi:catechol 2,3-dioxygenase-like lactoylglutathione lyase family enzyme